MTLHKETCTLYDVIFEYKGQLIKFALFAPDPKFAQEMGELQVHNIISCSVAAITGPQLSGNIRKELVETTVIQFMGCNISPGY